MSETAPAPARWPRTLPKDYPPLRGYFEELTRESFAKYCSWQCTDEEIAGVVGAPVERLAAWVRRAYRLDPELVIKMLHMAGRVAIRKAAFELMVKNGTVNNQQFGRYVPMEVQDSDEADAAIASLMRMLKPAPEMDGDPEASDDYGEDAE